MNEKTRKEKSRENLIAQNPKIYKLNEKIRKEKSREIIKKRDKESFFNRYKNFRKKIRFGLLYSCICCHKRIHVNGLDNITFQWCEKVKAQFEDIIEKSTGVKDLVTLTSEKMCKTCKFKIEKGKFPDISHRNVHNFQFKIKNL